MFSTAEIVSVVLGALGFLSGAFVIIKDLRKIENDKIEAESKAKAQVESDESNRKKLLEDVTDATFRRMKALLDETKDALKDAEFRLRDAEKRLAENERRQTETDGRIMDLENENNALRLKVEALTAENSRHIETIKTLTLRIEQSEKKER